MKRTWLGLISATCGVIAAGGFLWGFNRLNAPPKPSSPPTAANNQIFTDTNNTANTTPPSSIPTPTTPVTTAPVVNAPVRGVIEGFYGQPWSDAERIRMFQFMSENHFNTYVYAPKDDPYQRADWSSPYPATRAAQMQNLVGAANRNGIRFVYSISPGIPEPLPGQTLTAQMEAGSITFTSAKDRAKLEAKINQLRGMGVHTFMLSFDDVEPYLKTADKRVYGNDYARAHIDLANAVWRDEHATDPNFSLWLAPTKYYGVADNSYWQEIRSHLSSSIKVIWTGKWVLNAQITSSDATQIAHWLGRKPLLWDNYPVNDYTYAVKKRPALLMGPLSGRSADLLSHLAGYMANPMIQPEASKVPLATIGSWLANPSHYVATFAWKAAVAGVNGVGDGDALLHFSEYASVSTLNTAGSSPFGNLASAYWNASSTSGKVLAEANLRHELSAVQALPGRLHATVTNSELLAEINPWLIKLGNEAGTALSALDMLDTPTSDAKHAQLHSEVATQVQTLKSQSLSIGDDIVVFIDKALSQ